MPQASPSSRISMFVGQYFLILVTTESLHQPKEKNQGLLPGHRNLSKDSENQRKAQDNHSQLTFPCSTNSCEPSTRLTGWKDSGETNN